MHEPGGSRRRGPGVAWLLFLGLAIVHTWPLGSAPAHLSLNYNADAEQGAWTLAWIAHTLPSDPAHLFDGNVFAPERNTLAYSEPMFVPALVGAPVWWLGGSAVLTYNLSLIVGLTLTAWTTWFVAWRWTGSPVAALTAGALGAFNPHLLTRLPHIMAAYAWTIPLSLYLADRLIEAPRRRTALALALAVAATASTSIYWLALVGLIIAAVSLAAMAGRHWRALAYIAAGAMGGLVLAAPLLWPYVAFASTGVSRPLESVFQFSATPGGYLATPSRLHAWWSRAFYVKDVSVFFAGFTALALALFAWPASAMNVTTRRRGLLLLVVAITGVVLSLGPTTSVYRAAYEWVFPLRGLRAAARFGYLYLMAVALASALGLAWLMSRRARAQLTMAIVALVAVNAEAWSAPIATRPYSRVPGIYDRLKSIPGSVLLAEMPFYPPEAVFENGEYMLNSTAHWRPLMNGTSGFTPDSYRRRTEFLWYFPEDRALDGLVREGATHVMVHLERFTPEEVAAIETKMRSQTVLRLIASDARGHRLYEVRR